MKIAKYKCKECGAPLDLGDGSFEMISCVYCGAKFINTLIKKKKKKKKSKSTRKSKNQNIISQEIFTSDKLENISKEEFHLRTENSIKYKSLDDMALGRKYTKFMYLFLIVIVSITVLAAL